MGRQIERKREREREGKGREGKGREEGEKGGKINCCFIMFSSDLTLAVVVVRMKI